MGPPFCGRTRVPPSNRVSLQLDYDYITTVVTVTHHPRFRVTLFDVKRDTGTIQSASNKQPDLPFADLHAR